MNAQYFEKVREYPLRWNILETLARHVSHIETVVPFYSEDIALLFRERSIRVTDLQHTGRSIKVDHSMTSIAASLHRWWSAKLPATSRSQESHSVFCPFPKTAIIEFSKSNRPHDMNTLFTRALAIGIGHRAKRFTWIDCSAPIDDFAAKIFDDRHIY
jgi:hypothetical protein